MGLNSRDRQTLIPTRRLNSGSATGKNDPRRKRPGLSNLNRPTNVIRTVESAAIVHTPTPILEQIHPKTNPAEIHSKNNNEASDESDSFKILEEEFHTNSGDLSSATESDEITTSYASQLKSSPTYDDRNKEFSTKSVSPSKSNSKSKATYKLCSKKGEKDYTANTNGFKHVIGFVHDSSSEEEAGDPRIYFPSSQTLLNSENTNAKANVNGNRKRNETETFHYDYDLNCDLLPEDNYEEEEEEDVVDVFGDDSESLEGNRLKVPRIIQFMKQRRNSKAFIAYLDIQNVSDSYMTFSVKTSSPQMFRVNPSVSSIAPRMKLTVKVETNPSFELHFSEISQESFKVFATPLYSKSMTCDEDQPDVRQEQLEVLWRAYGSKLFPSIAAESHSINYTCQLQNPLLSTMGNIVDNGLLDSSPWRSRKPVVIHELPAVTEEEFYNSWPLENDHYTFMTSRNQMDGWHRYLRKVQSEKMKWKWNLRKCVAAAAFIFFTIGVIYCGIFSPSFQSQSVAEEVFTDKLRRDKVDNVFSTNLHSKFIENDKNAHGLVHSILDQFFQSYIWI